MATERKKHGILFIVSGLAMLLVTTLFLPYVFHDMPRPIEIGALLMVPAGLVLIVLGIFRLGVNAVVAISEKRKRPPE